MKKAPENIFEAKILPKFPDGIFIPESYSPNFSICIWLQNSVDTFFDLNSKDFQIKKPNFYLIKSESINACAFPCEGYNFLGVTKGLIDYSSFIFRNILLDNNFFKHELDENNIQQPEKINDEDYQSWTSFCQKNNISFDSLFYTPNNSHRRIIAEALSQYFIFFIIVHETGHLRQKNPNFIFEFNTLSNDDTDNLINQVREMDADKFAINQLANHLIYAFKNKNLFNNASDIIFFKNEEIVVRYSLFILFFMFYFFSHNKKFEKYILENRHPHPKLRLLYSSLQLIECFYINSFLSKEKLDNCLRESIHDFGNTLKRIFPNADIKKYFDLIKDKDLQNHYLTLQEEAKNLKNLNGIY